MLHNLPDIFIDNLLSFLNDKTIINIALCCTNIYTDFKYIIDNRREIKETALENGERYKKIISFYENMMIKKPHDIFDSLSDEKYQKEMDEWYSLLKINDIIYNHRYTYIYKELSGFLQILDKPGMDHYDHYENYHFYKLLLHNFVNTKNTQFSILVPHCVLIPPRTDILIL
jgi:hypothetical protein